MKEVCVWERERIISFHLWVQNADVGFLSALVDYIKDYMSPGSPPFSREKHLQQLGTQSGNSICLLTLHLQWRCLLRQKAWPHCVTKNAAVPVLWAAHSISSITVETPRVTFSCPGPFVSTEVLVRAKRKRLERTQVVTSLSLCSWLGTRGCGWRGEFRSMGFGV